MDVLQIVNAVQPGELTEALHPPPPDDRFCCSFDVPRIEGPVEHDFSSSTSPEGRLKRLLMVRNRSDVASAFGRRSTLDDMTSVAAQGMGGVGKTFALRGLGRDEELRYHFVDGV